MRAFRVYRQSVHYLLPYTGRFVVAVAEVLLIGAVEVLKPWPLKIVIDNVVGGAPVQSDWIPPMDRASLLTAACASVITLYLALAILQVTNNYLTISIGQRMVNDLRSRLFEHLQRLSLSFHRRRELGDLMMRITYDTFSIQTIAMNGLFPVLSAGILLAGMFAVMIRIDATLTLIALVIVPALLILIAAISRPIDRLASRARIKESRVYDVAHRALSAIQVVQAFTSETEAHREFVETSRESLGENLKLYTFQTIYSGAVNVLLAVGTAIVIYVGARHALAGKISVGDLVVFTTYLASLYGPINQMFQTYGMVQSAKAGMRRCLELLEHQPEIRDRPGARTLGRARGEIEFDNVVFGYDGNAPVLRGISFKAAAGETIAIVGPTGAGKTTMASLLARFYEPQHGRILIDGQDVSELTLKSLRSNISIVLQPPLVLTESVRSNIALGKPGASIDEIERAARLARLEPVLDKLPKRLDEIVGQGGHSLSQGEAQRVTIARAMVKDAPILIMDEPTSALDAETEAMVLAAVQESMRGRTTLVIAHRLSTIQNADRILVLRDGVIEEQGNFAELVTRGGFFSQLYNLQSGKEVSALRR